MSDRVWVCTDVGGRTICTAKLLEDLQSSNESGPPYSIAGWVLDARDMDACEVAPASVTLLSFIQTEVRRRADDPRPTPADDAGAVVRPDR